MSTKGQRQRRRLHASAPPSGQQPVMNLAPRDVEAMAEELVIYHEMFHDLFQRREQREWSAFYLRGQLSDLERKTVEPMVLATHGPDAAAVRAGQQFLGQGAWDDTAILVRHQRLVAESLGEPDGVVSFDGSGFPKQGTHSVGVARQYCGAVGKIANCQHGVFAAYASRHGYTFLDRRLYIPEVWFDQAHAPLRQRYGVPADLTFQTEPQLALEMLDGLVARAEVPFSWVVADEHYGMIPSFLDGVEARQKWYFVEVPPSTHVWGGAPKVEAPSPGALGRPRKHLRLAPGEAKAQELAQVGAGLPAEAWQRDTIKEGSQGPIEAMCAFVRVTRARRGRPGAPAWAVLRRSTDATDELKVFLSNAPATCAPADLVRVSGLRWPVETALEEAKGELGMDHYEARTWRGWHHHMTQTFLAHHFLVRMRLNVKKKRLLSLCHKRGRCWPSPCGGIFSISIGPLKSSGIIKCATMLPIDPIGSVRFTSIVNVNGSLRPLKSRCSTMLLSQPSLYPQTPAEEASTYQWFVGIDWGAQTHQVYVLDSTRHRVGERVVEHEGTSVAQLATWLITLAAGQPSQVAVALELPRGAVVETLVERGFHVFALNPKQLDRFRDRHTVAGAKDDRRDAFVLADALRTDLPAFRRVRLDAPAFLMLRELSRTEEALQTECRRATNRLRDQLHRFYPQMLQLCPAADEAWLWALLDLVPTPAHAALVTPAKVQRLLKTYRIRRVTAAEVVALLQTPALQVAPGAAEAASAPIALLLPCIRVLAEQLKRCATHVETLLATLAAPSSALPGPSDITIIQSLPGAGRKMTAWLLAEAAQPLAARDYRVLRTQGGVAPVTRQSGKRRQVLMRYGCNQRLRNALFHMARVAVKNDSIFRQSYATARAKGHSHGRTLRGIADRLLQLLMAMLRDRTLYDPTRVRGALPAPTPLGKNLLQGLANG